MFKVIAVAVAIAATTTAAGAQATSASKAAVKTSTDEALAMVGADAETPIVVLADSGPIGVSGPMLSWVPTGDAALRLWDAMRTLAEEPAFGEVRRRRQWPIRFPILD